MHPRSPLTAARALGLATALALHAHCGGTRAVPAPHRVGVADREPAAPPPRGEPSGATARAASADPSSRADASAAARAEEPAVQRPWLVGQTGGPGAPPASAGAGAGAADLPAGWTRGDARARIGAVASAYLAWGRVDDDLRWAPYDCRMPEPSLPRFSTASEASPHGQKLYFVYARDRAAYVVGHTLPAGQVVVKESWRPHPVDLAHAARIGPTPIVAARDGQTFEPEHFAGLFIMIHVPAGTPDSDAGWIYGTSSPSGEVTSAGRVASCIGCHEQAGPSRLFGLHAAH